MTRDIAAIRRDYEGGRLDTESSPEAPFTLFDEWFRLACDSEGEDSNVMTLATTDTRGLPHARMVLLKGYDERGMVFYTNYHSHKGSELSNVPQAALVFWWPSLSRQIRIEGEVKKVSEAESDNYFASRPRGSRLSAWIATQSVEIPDHQWLVERQARYEQLYSEQEISRPAHWGGYRVEPRMIEFWQGQPNRLHDRVRYEIRDDNWSKFRLAP